MNALFYSSERRLPVLMYHKISLTATDYLTVSTRQLEEQLSWLQQAGYSFIAMSGLAARLKTGTLLPDRPVLLTFDDGYKSTLEIAYPVLKKYSAKACIFLPTYFIGGQSDWDENPADLMSAEQIKHLDAAIFEVGLHSHRHQNYKNLSANEIQEDADQNWRFLEMHDIDFQPAFAYPYGGRPKNKKERTEMKEMLYRKGIELGFRIGNRINVLPQIPAGLLRTAFLEMNRIDVRGTESLEVFKRKVRFGKLSIF